MLQRNAFWEKVRFDGELDDAITTIVKWRTNCMQIRMYDVVLAILCALLHMHTDLLQFLLQKLSIVLPRSLLNISKICIPQVAHL